MPVAELYHPQLRQHRQQSKQAGGTGGAQKRTVHSHGTVLCWDRRRFRVLPAALAAALALCQGVLHAGRHSARERAAVFWWANRYCPSPALSSSPVPLDLSQIRAVSLDLDDTLWPVWPTIARAETALQDWLHQHAPATQMLCAQPDARLALRAQAARSLPGSAHDMSALRQEAIRLALLQAGDDPQLASAAFEVFLAERQRVELFEDALPALEFLSRRYPLVALSNGNADVSRIGLQHFFAASVGAHEVGCAKPDARMFQRAADRVDVAASQVLHIGDDALHDGVGALAAGMQMAWLNRAAKPWEHAPWEPHLTVAGLDALCIHLADA
ncbi:HAD family hydrolase [Simplicispira suum]|uniref:HAD family hydrolase n=1 Tax=Simplicispira suum TaxID=2109915 RepID=A0A2S0N2B8_9BURK|nr:HAD family hydrolase [Simplicispira suum]